MQAQISAPRPRHPAWAIPLFLALAALGLLYVKWWPYAGRAFTAADTHSIGSSILTAGATAAPEPSLQAALDYAWAYGLSIWKALVLGLLLGSAVQALIPQRWVLRLLGAGARRGLLAGSLLAVPSMMCTCCAAPVINGLRARNAAPGNSAAYWLGNPMLNPATLVFMGLVIGWHWAGLRLVLGAALVLTLGWLLNRMARRRGELAPPAAACTAAADTADSEHLLRRWLRALAGLTLRLLPEYLVIVLLLGAVRAWLFPALDLSVDNSLLWIAGLALAGTLFVIPTAGEIPIVQAALALGMAAGPAAALLFTLPAISLPSLAMVARSFRKSELLVLAGGVFTCGLVGAGAAIALGF